GCPAAPFRGRSDRFAQARLCPGVQIRLFVERESTVITKRRSAPDHGQLGEGRRGDRYSVLLVEIFLAVWASEAAGCCHLESSPLVGFVPCTEFARDGRKLLSKIERNRVKLILLALTAMVGDVF